MAIDGILEDVTDLCTRIVLQLRDATKSILLSSGVEDNCIANILKPFDEQSPFCKPFRDIDTWHRQLSFYKDHFKLIVSPQMHTCT